MTAISPGTTTNHIFFSQKYRTHRTHRTLSPEYESQDIMPLHLREDSVLLMKKEVRLVKTYFTGQDAHQSPVETVGDLPEHFVTKDSHFTKGRCFRRKEICSIGDDTED